MTVFNTFLKVLNKCKAPVIMYTVFLVIFSSFSTQNTPVSTTFTEEKARIAIVNHDKYVGLTKHLVDYLSQTCEVVEIEEEMLDDSLFYRDIHLILEIPDHYHDSLLSQKDTSLSIKQNGTYAASLAKMQLERYLRAIHVYQDMGLEEEEIITRTNDLLEQEVDVEVTSKVDTSSLSKATFYYNFTNYTILAGCIYVICLVLSSFHEEKVQQRTIVSSMPTKKHNRILLWSNLLFASIFWIFSILLSFVIVGNIMLSYQGGLYLLNSFCFLIFATTLAFLISNLIHNKNSLNGIINVIALGSSFLCGAFVPMDLLPPSVLTFAHILPSYYFVKTNELIGKMELVNMESVMPLIINMGILLLFSLGVLLINQVISKRKRQNG